MRKGELWERKLEAWHRQYLLAGTAIIHRCHPGVRQQGAKWWYESEGPPDFVGLAMGRHVCFDAKVTALPSGKLPFKNIEAHQARAFNATIDLGGVTFLAVETVTGEWLVPWSRVREPYRAWAGRQPGPSSCDPAAIGFRIPAAQGWLEPFRLEFTR